MYRDFFFVAGLVLASTAQAQTPDRTIMMHIAVDYAIAGMPSGTTTLPGESASFTDAPIAGSQALLGVPSPLPVDGAGAERQSSFRAEVRGDVTNTAWGKAEFGAVQNPDRSSGAFVVSLGAYSQQAAILFTRRSGTPLEVGRYRISQRANEPDEIPNSPSRNRVVRRDDASRDHLEALSSGADRSANCRYVGTRWGRYLDQYYGST